MNKKIIIGLLLITFISVFCLGQDCGKCPSRKFCGKVKAKKSPAVLVYLDKDSIKSASKEVHYHKKDCPLVKFGIKIQLKNAKTKGYTPCPKCFSMDKKAPGKA